MTRQEIKIAFIILLVVIVGVLLFNVVLRIGIIVLIVLAALYLIKKVFFS